MDAADRPLTGAIEPAANALAAGKSDRKIVLPYMGIEVYSRTVFVSVISERFKGAVTGHCYGSFLFLRL